MVQGRHRCLPVQKHQRREKIVLKLRNKGKTYKEIASVTGLSESTVSYIVNQLIKKGETEKKNNVSYLDLDNSRCRTIIEMTKSGASQAEIGRKLGITRERVRQIKKKMEKRHGISIFKPDSPFYSTAEAANSLGLDQSYVRMLCKKRLVPCRFRSRADKRISAYLLDEAGIEAVRQYKKNKHYACCLVCGCYFEKRRYKTAQKVCSDACRKQRSHNYKYRVASEDNLRGWHLELWRKLQNHLLSKNEQWLVHSEAVKYTGLSGMQISRLRATKIITIRPHPSKKWRGRPVAQFALSELRIVREVWQANQKNK